MPSDGYNTLTLNETAARRILLFYKRTKYNGEIFSDWMSRMLDWHEGERQQLRSFAEKIKSVPMVVRMLT